MAEDWYADVQKYDPEANPNIVAGIVRYCGIALQKRDSSLVSFTSPDELGRVRENFLKKKLGRTEPDSALDEAIAAVGEIMKGDRTKNRVTVYYLLARHFSQHDSFDRSRTSRKSAEVMPIRGIVSPEESTQLFGSSPTGASVEPPPSTSPVAGAGAVEGGLAAAAGSAEEATPEARRTTGGFTNPSSGDTTPRFGRGTLGEAPPSISRSSARFADEQERTGSKWWLWLILGAIALLLLFLLLRG